MNRPTTEKPHQAAHPMITELLNAIRYIQDDYEQNLKKKDKKPPYKPLFIHVEIEIL